MWAVSDNNEKKSAAKRRKPRAKAEPLKVAAERIAKLLCELSDDRTLFVSDGGAQQERKVDTKALKEFSGVLKEMSAVMNELGVKEADGKAVRIEFSDEAMDMGQ